MPINRVDMLFSKAGRPIVVIEAKARPLSPDFERSAMRQLSIDSSELGTPWALLVDPKETRLFHAPDMEHPVARVSTDELLGEAFTDRPRTIGEQVILVALERVVPRLREHQDFLRHHPGFREFASAVAGAESTSEPETWPKP